MRFAVAPALWQSSDTGCPARLAQTIYLPRLDLIWQENRASTNNVFGALLPQGGIPSISGPVLGTKSLSSAFGSAGGVLFSWEPFDFGLRKASVDVARNQTRQAYAAVIVTRLDVMTSAADLFMTQLAAQEAVRAAQANVARAQVFADAVHVLVNNQLRAGADAARTDAELSTAKNQLYRAQQSEEISRAALAEIPGTPGTAVTLEAGPLLNLPQDTSIPSPNFESHPLVIAQKAAIETVQARVHVLDRSYFPKFNLQSAFSGRGTGALTNGKFKGGVNGLFPAPQTSKGLGHLYEVRLLREHRSQSRRFHSAWMQLDRVAQR
jgi:outer membrane protein